MKRTKRVRLTDVAEAAGVSQAAVSMALRDSPEIGAKTREKIKRVCVTMGYVGPHVRATGPAGGKKSRRRYGLLVLRIHDNMYIETVLDALSQSAVEKEGRVEVHVISHLSDREKVIERCVAFASHVDGLILSGWVERYVLEALDARGIPFVTVGPYHEDPNAIPARLNRSVMFDSSAMGRHATQHLIDHGHTRIGFVVEQMPLHMFNAGWYDGYRLACLNSMGEFNPDHVFLGDGVGTADLMAQIVIRQKMRPTAYVITSPAPAALFMRTLASHGVKVERRHVVVCGDETSLAQHKLLDHPCIVRNLAALAEAGIARLHQMVTTGVATYGVWMMPFEKRNF